MARSIIQMIHDIEVNGGIAWPQQGGILIHFGCPLDGIRFDEAFVGSFREAEEWLHDALLKYPETSSAYAKLTKGRRPPKEKSPIIQLLFEHRIPGSVFWIYDSAFTAIYGDPNSTGWTAPSAGLSSWAETEQWFEREARERHPAMFDFKGAA